MPKLELDDGRFLRIGDRQSPDLLIDAAAIAAVVLDADGTCAVHLAGGQTLQLAAAPAGELLKRLAREKPKAEAAPPAKAGTPKPKRRRRSAAPAESPSPAVPLRTSVGRYLSRLFD